MEDYKALYLEAIEALKPFADRWRHHTAYLEAGLTPPPGLPMTAITPGALKRAAGLVYGETVTSLDYLDKLIGGE